MSKKQSQKKKVTVKIVPGQAVFVADAHIMQHIAETYIEMANSYSDQSDAEACREVANSVYEWLEKTYFNPESDFSDEEW